MSDKLRLIKAMECDYQVRTGLSCHCWDGPHLGWSPTQSSLWTREKADREQYNPWEYVGSEQECASDDEGASLCSSTSTAGKWSNDDDDFVTCQYKLDQELDDNTPQWGNSPSRHEAHPRDRRPHLDFSIWELRGDPVNLKVLETCVERHTRAFDEPKVRTAPHHGLRH